MIKSHRLATNLAKKTEKELKGVLAAIPEDCTATKMYPETLNFCECYLLAQAISVHFPPTTQFQILSDQKVCLVTASAIDVDFLYKLTVNYYGSGVELIGVDGTLYFATHRDDLYVVLAGSKEFVKSAIPFPDDIWDAYFEQFMWKYETEFEVIRNEFRGWLNAREKAKDSAGGIREG